MRRVLAACSLLLIAVGCATPGSPTESGESGRNVLTQEDMVDFRDMDAYETVRRLRPQWLRTRGESTSGLGSLPVQVHVDGQHLGDAEDILVRIPTVQVLRMSYLDSSTATIRYGVGFQNGTILVETRR